MQPPWTPNSSAETCAGLERRQKTKSTYINLYLIIPIVCLTGARLVEAASCQSAETYERAATVYSLLLHHRRCFSDGRTDGQMILWRYTTQTIALSLNLHDGGVWHAQTITVDMNPSRGHCNGTWYGARQVYCRLPSFTHRELAVRRGVAMLKSAKHSLFL